MVVAIGGSELHTHHDGTGFLITNSIRRSYSFVTISVQYFFFGFRKLDKSLIHID